jgi:hypothetical protein
MSMFVNVIRVTPAMFEVIKKDPSVLEAVLDGDEKVMKKLGIKDADSQGFDYMVADDMMDAMENVDDDDDDEDGDDDDDDDEEDEEDDAVFKDLGADGKLDFDAGYGPTYTLSPAAVKKAVKSSVVELDDDVRKLFKEAAKRGDYVIALVT